MTQKQKRMGQFKVSGSLSQEEIKGGVASTPAAIPGSPQLGCKTDAPVHSVNGKTGAVILNADDIEPTASRGWFTSLLANTLSAVAQWVSEVGSPHVANKNNPHETSFSNVKGYPTTPEGKVLTDRGTFDFVSAGGATNMPLYASNVDSLAAGYKILAGAPDANEVVKTIVANAASGVVAGEAHLSANPIGVSLIPAGTFEFGYWRAVDHSQGDSFKQVEIFTRSAAGVETSLFTLESSSIDDTTLTERVISRTISQSYVVNPAHFLGVRFKFRTNRATDTTLSYIIGGSLGWWMRTTLPLKHDDLSDKNGNPDFQHITAAEKTAEAVKAVCLGDSITEGNLAGGQYSYCSFPPFSTYGAINCGIGGTTLSTHQNSHYAPFSITELVKAIVDNNWTTQDTQADYLAGIGDDNRPILARLKAVDWSTVTDLMIFSGANDFGITLPNQIGDVTSTSNYTIFGAMAYIINKFSTAYPSIKLHFVTPIFRSRIVTGDGKNSDDNTNSLGLLLRDYANAIRYSCELNHVNCIDAHNMSGVNKYTAPALLQDGLHPNQAGAAYLAAVLWRGLRGQSNTSITDNRLIKRYVLDANTQNVPISTDNLGRSLAIHNLKDIILVVDGECTATTAGALKIALNGVNTGYNTTGFADADGFSLTVDGILDFEAYLRVTKTLNYKVEGYRAATLSPQVNPASQNLKGKNLSITSIISSITIFSSAKTLKTGTVIEIWKRY